MVGMGGTTTIYHFKVGELWSSTQHIRILYKQNTLNGCMMVMCPSFRNQWDSCSLCHPCIIFAQVTTNSCSRTIDNTLPMLGFHDHFRWKTGVGCLDMSGLWFPNIFNFPFYLGRSISRKVPTTYWMVVFSPPVLGGWPSGISHKWGLAITTVTSL